MTRDEIIRMAREAGLVREWMELCKKDEDALARFAALVAAAEHERIAAEWDGCMYCDLEDVNIGAAIRARGQA